MRIGIIFFTILLNINIVIRYVLLVKWIKVEKRLVNFSLRKSKLLKYMIGEMFIASIVTPPGLDW